MNKNTMYATRKRRKPIQKRVKPPAEGGTSTPSKRHRDRLNGELERLANVLPFSQDVISKLDKLTVLRLSVSYLRAKSFFNMTVKSDSSLKPDGNDLQENFLEGELLLQVLNGFVLVATSHGEVFYVSSTIQEYLGFHQSDIIHQNVYDLIHTEDRPEFRRQLHWALEPTLSLESGQTCSDGRNAQLSLAYYRPGQLPPENSTFLKRNFVCRVRCLLDNTPGFLAMNFQGRLKFLQVQNQRMTDGLAAVPQLVLFAVVSPLQPPSILEIRTKNFIFRTKHKLDFTPTACDAKGKRVLGYTDAEFCYGGTGYQFIHAADILHCAESHIRIMKTGESEMTVFRLLTKQGAWVWVEAKARLLYKNGKPDGIIASQRVITNEEGEENLARRNLKLPFNFTTGEAILCDTNGMRMEGHSSHSKGTRPLDPKSLLWAMLKQDESAYVSLPAQNPISFQHSTLPDSGEEPIPSGDRQDDIWSLSKNGVFKQESINSSEEDKNGGLLSFMKGLGMSREDRELFQKDQEFLQFSLDEPGDIMDVADEILSYEQESLKTSDSIFSNTAERKPSGQECSCAPQSQLPHAVPQLHHGHPLLQPQQQKPVLQQHRHTRIHAQHTFPQQYLHTQKQSHHPVPQQHPCSQQLISCQQTKTQQLTLVSQQHPQTLELAPQQHPQTLELAPQQHPHGETEQLVSQQHLQMKKYTQQPIPQLHLHTQAFPWQPIPEPHTLAQQQIPQQQIVQQHPLTQTCKRKTTLQQHLLAQMHPQHEIPQQHMNKRTHPKQQVLQQRSCSQLTLSPPLQKEQPHKPLEQPPSPNVAQPQLSHHLRELPLKQAPHQEERLLHPERQQQLRHKMKPMQLSGKGPSLEQPVAMPTANGHPFPSLLCAEWNLLQYGHLIQEGSTLHVPYQNQLNTVSIASDQGLSSYRSTEGRGQAEEAGEAGSFTLEDLDNLLESWQPSATGEQHLATILQEGNDTPLCHPTALPMNQRLPETSGIGHRQVNPKLLTPGTLGHQPFLLHFQNGSSEGISQTHPASIYDVDLLHPLYWHPDESRLFQDLTMGEVM